MTVTKPKKIVVAILAAMVIVSVCATPHSISSSSKIVRVGVDSFFSVSPQMNQELITTRMKLELITDFSDDSQTIYTGDATARNKLLSALIVRSVAGARLDGWDGLGPIGVSEETCNRALSIVGLLPAYLAIPDVSILSTGGVVLEWEKGASVQLAIIAPAAGGISFAASLNGDRLQGAMRFETLRLPSEIASAAARWDETPFGSG